MSGAQRPLHVYQIADHPPLNAVWGLVRELSTIPADLDVEAYQRHINQPELVKARNEIDSLPCAERIAYEYATCEQNLRSPKTKSGPLNRLQKKNGVVKLGPGMDRERRFLLTRLLSDFFGQPVLESGNYLYPPGGFKEWHTNMASTPGWRMYIINKSPHGKSFFRYVDPVTTTLETHWDEDGQINIFHVNSKEPFWHAVRSIDAHRWSKGYVIPDNWREKFDS
jgi:hypothetical protein